MRARAAERMQGAVLGQSRTGNRAAHQCPLQHCSLCNWGNWGNWEGPQACWEDKREQVERGRFIGMAVALPVERAGIPGRT